jgi:hypothetical protein
MILAASGRIGTNSFGVRGMPESDKTETVEAAGGPGGKKARKAAAAGGTRELSARAERSLKDVDRLLRKSPEAAPQEKAMAQLEQAKVMALLQLAEAIRENRKAESPPA